MKEFTDDIAKKIFSDVDEIFYKTPQPSYLINKYNDIKKKWD